MNLKFLPLISLLVLSSCNDSLDVTGGGTPIATATPTATAAPSATATPSPSPTPSPTPVVSTLPQRNNLLAEYLLQEGAGITATDSSGNANNGTITGATWDSTLDLNFAANNKFIQMPTAVNQLNTFQIAMYVPSYNTFGLPSAYGDAASYPANQSILCGTDASHTCVIASNGMGRSHHFFSFNSSSSGATEPLSVGWHIVTLVAGVNGDQDHIYYDGVEVNAYSGHGNSYFLHPVTGNYQIGGSAQYSQTWFRGKIAATWAWSSALSPNDVSLAYQAAHKFILQKGIVENILPIVHSNPVVVGGLDSRTYGLGLSGTANSWITTLALTDNTYTGINLGSNGAFTYDTVPLYDLTYGLFTNPFSASTIQIFWGGVNDFLFGSFSPRSVANSLRDLVQKGKAQGARVIVATEISSKGNGGDVNKAALNAIIRNEAFGWGADNIADLGTIPQVGADNAWSSANFADGLHPNDTGETYIRAVMSNNVNELIGSTLTSRHKTSAASYLEVAGDRFLDLTNGGAQTITLPDCIGYSLPREILNLGGATATLATSNAEILSGSPNLPVFSRAILIPVPGPSVTAGCSWERIQ